MDFSLFFGGNFGVFFQFWYFVPRKIWQPCNFFLAAPKINLRKRKKEKKRDSFKSRFSFTILFPKGCNVVSGKPVFFLRHHQGCQMVRFQNKNPNLGKFSRALQWKMLVYCMYTWSILRSFVIFYGHLV
jgi:hypothetical protein